MVRARLIPCLLLRGRKLVKTRQFQDAIYVGDPLNTVKLFCDLLADEIIVLDIAASAENTAPDFELLRRIATIADVPLAYGGGIKTVETAEALIQLGIEKVVINSEARRTPELVSVLAQRIGSQSVVAAMDVLPHHQVGFQTSHGISPHTPITPAPVWARTMERLGAGELLVTSVLNDGMMSGYNTSLVRAISSAVKIPVVACGGGDESALEQATSSGASAAAVGSYFVFHKTREAVLVSYPNRRK